MTGEKQEEPKQYALRLTPRAERDIEAAIVHFADTAGFEIALAWRGRLFEEITSLATNPTRFPFAPEMPFLRNFKGEFRQLVWRRAASSVAYRIIFWIEEESDDGPTVNVAYVRHGSAKPITRKDVRDLHGKD